jgi:predicted rRNA methylase YqxC with S4 and FtsJ domains
MDGDGAGVYTSHSRMRLDLLLIRRHPEMSRRKAQDVIEKGQVSVSGERVREPGRDVPRRRPSRSTRT